MATEIKLSGKIKQIGETQEGTSKAGKAWKKLTFQICNNEGYNDTEQVFQFELFGEEKVDKFVQYNKVGDSVDVKFNIDCREWNGKYYTNLSAWSVWKDKDQADNTISAGGHDSSAESEDVPF